MEDYEKYPEWLAVQERIDANEVAQEKASALADYLDNEWQSLIVERARIEIEIERNN